MHPTPVACGNRNSHLKHETHFTLTHLILVCNSLISNSLTFHHYIHKRKNDYTVLKFSPVLYTKQNISSHLYAQISLQPNDMKLVQGNKFAQIHLES